jgi:nucleotide-binding universal stress UspA family protein
MSSHGYSGLERWALGSVAERVLHDAPCPVFVVRDEALPQRLLITLDGSPLAETVLPPALEVARLLRLPVCLLRVERAPHPGESTSHALHIERAQTYLDDRCLHLQDDGPHVETVVLQGRPAPAILDYAAHNNFDAIALATHGFSGLRRWIYGSVTAKILRAAQCSLLVVRPHWESDTVEEYSPFIP